MSLTEYTYPSNYAVGEDGGGSYIGQKTYYKENEGRITDFSGCTSDTFTLQLHPQTDPYTRPLIIHLQDLDNDLSVTLEYFMRTFGSLPERYTMSGNIVTKRKSTGEVIDSFAIGEGDYYEGSAPIGWDLGSVNSGLPVIKYVPSSVNYGDYSAVHVGDPAQSINTLGCFYCSQNPQHDSVDELVGVMNYNDRISGHYWILPITNGTVRNDAQLAALQDGIIDAGNGKDPFIDPIVPSENPFENDPSRIGGGKGKYTKNGDTTGKPGLPSSAVLSSGFIAMYAPSTSNLQSLGAKLWSDDFFDNFIKLWNDPMEAIISLGLVPFTPTSSGSSNCVIGNYDTEISMPRVTAQYQTLSCGSVYIDEYWGSALDYSPYCEAEIFLPFCGMKKLDIDDVMGKTVSVDYNVDLLGGEAVCYVTVDDVVLYDYRCNLQTSVPISATSYASLYSNIIKGVSGLAIGGAAGSATGAAAGAITSAVNVITSKHSSMERGSELSPNAGVLGLLTPYIILHRVVQSLPSGFNQFKGYPSNVTRTLSSCSGYTEVEYIHLDNINATEEEKNELLSILHEGIMI